MKKEDVQINATYLIKVAGNLAPVKITREHPGGGWEGTSVKTGKTIRIKSRQRIQKRLAEEQAKSKDGRAAGERSVAPSATGAKRTAKASKDAKVAAKRDTGQRRAKGAKRTSGLDAAAKVLAETGEPMSCKAIVERMLAKGLWQTNGKTPAATIYAAIIREISKKGDHARFRKVERGQFKLAKGG